MLVNKVWTGERLRLGGSVDLQFHLLCSLVGNILVKTGIKMKNDGEKVS